MNKESVPSASLLVVQGNPQLSLTLTSANKRKVNLSLDELKVSIEVILAPASNPAPCAGAILEGVRKLFLRRRKTGSVDVGVVQVDVLVNKEDGKVIAESGIAHERVLEDPSDSVFFMSEGLWGVETTGIIFTNSHFQKVSFLKRLELMSSSEDLPCGSPVVIVGVVRDDHTGSNKVIVLVEEETSPGELTHSCLSMGEVGVIKVSLTTELALICRKTKVLIANLLPEFKVVGLGNIASIPGKGIDIHARVIAAALEANRAEVLFLLCGGNVDNSGGNLSLHSGGAVSGIDESLTHKIKLFLLYTRLVGWDAAALGSSTTRNLSTSGLRDNGRRGSTGNSSNQFIVSRGAISKSSRRHGSSSRRRLSQCP